MKIAVMQPYFFPYLGYYQLLSQVDIFVIFDCVQFPRRGWVHRNKFTMKNGAVDWITLPIIKGGRDDTKISDLRFKEGSSGTLLKQFEGTQIFKAIKSDEKWFSLVFDTDGTVTDYLFRTLKSVSQEFGQEARILRSSFMNIPSSLRGKDRIIHIVNLLGGTTYVNLSGGVDLYDRKDFLEYGIELKILNPYKGSKLSTLERILLEEKTLLIKDLTQ